MNKNKRYKILCLFESNNPHPTTELVYNSSFELLIAVLLSAQSTDISVNKCSRELFLAANTPRKMSSLGVEGIKSYIKSIGLFNIKSEYIIKTCQILLDKHNGNVPEDRDALEKLPGIGRKSANVILNTFFKWPTIAVDTHVFRVVNRTGFAIGNSIILLEKNILAVVPNKFKINFHHWFVLHGRYVCLARKPHCGSCLIKNLCIYKNKNYIK